MRGNVSFRLKTFCSVTSELAVSVFSCPRTGEFAVSAAKQTTWTETLADLPNHGESISG